MHFSDERWSDYVRGLASETEAARIEQHLARKCGICNQSLRLWRAVAETAKGEVCGEIPQDALHASQTAYLTWWWRSLPQRARIARRVFDSFLEPLPAGIRSDRPSARRLLERAGQWSIDLRLEPAGGKRIALTGQIVQPRRRQTGVADLPVILMSREMLLAQAQANQFGEFQMQFDQADDLRVYIDVPGKQPIGIVLPDLDRSPAVEGTTHEGI